MLCAIFLILSGLVLIGNAGGKVPIIGKYLVKVGAWLGVFAVLIGIADIVIGIIDLL